jgi:hypothetical protein
MTNQSPSPKIQIKFFWTLFIVVICYLLFGASIVQIQSPAFAGELSGGNYIIKMGTINISGGKKSSESFRLTDTVGQTIQGQFERTGFRINAGFAYNLSREPFSFILSKNAVDFGAIKPGSFAKDVIVLAANGAGAYGYHISVIENHPLQTTDGKISLPDTSCDPSDKCTPTHASPWTSSVAYGFGYNLSGDDIDQSEFTDPTMFRPFADNTVNQDPIVIMSHQGKGKKANTRLTFQINVPPSQSSGAYQNTIQFIALPSF